LVSHVEVRAWLMVFETRVLRKTFESKGDEVKGVEETV
jgi:hypothetical protein